MNARTAVWLLLLTNLICLAAAAHFARRPHITVLTPEAPPPTAGKAPPRFSAGPRSTAGPAESAAPTPAFHWRSVESTDYKEYIANLRAIGCPEETIRDLIIADVTKAFAPRYLALQPPRPKNYWEAEIPEPAAKRTERNAQRMELEMEKRDLLRSLLGSDFDIARNAAMGAEDYYSRQFPFLSADKIAQTREVMEKYSMLERKIQQKSWDDGEELTAQDKAELKRIRQEREQALAGILTPAEKEQYELRTHAAASSTRYSLSLLSPTEQEFQAVYRIQKAFDENHGRENYQFDKPESRKLFEAANQQREEQIKAALGEPRYAEYKKAQAPEYRQFRELATRYELPVETADKLFGIKEALETQRRAIQTDRTIPNERKAAVLTQFSSETQSAMKELIGEKGYRYLQRRGQTYWAERN